MEGVNTVSRRSEYYIGLYYINIILVSHLIMEGVNTGSKGAPRMMDDIRVPRSMLTFNNRFVSGMYMYDSCFICIRCVCVRVCVCMCVSD